MHPDPDSLLRQLRSMNEEVCNAFFDAVHARIYAFCRKEMEDVHEAADVALEAFTISMQKVLQFDGLAGFTAYAFGCAKKTWRENYGRLFTLKRGGKKIVSLSAGEADGNPVEATVADPTPAPDEQLNRRQIRTALDEAMLELDEKCRRSIEDYYLEDKTLEESAKERSLATSTVKARRDKCLKLLRKLVNLRLKDVPG